MKTRHISIFLLGLSFFIWGCEDFLNINEDPNNPTEAPMSGLLSNVEVAMTGAIGMGGLSASTNHHVGQLVTRGTLSDYGISGQDFQISNPWDNLYLTTLTDLKVLIEQATALEAYNYLGIAQVLKAYTFSVLVDIYGDVPYTAANLGADNPTPAYDDDAVVYDSVFALLDRAVVNLNQESAIPLSGDIFYGNDSEETWIQVANTLKLRLLTQVSNVEDVSSEVSALLSEDNFFESGAMDLELQYGSSSNPDNRNPFYVSEYAPGAASAYIDPFFYEVMRGENTFFSASGNPYTAEGVRDPRIPYYFYNQLNTTETPQNPTAYYRPATGFLSIYKFSFNIDPNEGHDQGSSQTVIGIYPGGGRYDDGSGTDTNFNGAADTPQRLLTYYNLLFNRSELALQGITSEDPRALFEQGVRAAFAKVNEYASSAGAPELSSDVIDGYVSSALGLWDAAASTEEQLEILMIEKWKANFGHGIVAYNDYRRTGYPVLHDGDTDELAVTDKQRDFPTAYPWNTNSLSINPNAPSQKVAQTYTVFWDN